MDLDQALKHAKFKYMTTIIGLGIVTYGLVYNLYNTNNYKKNIHKEIGKLISEYEISDEYSYDKNYKLIQGCNEPWYFDPLNSEITQGVNKLQEKYPDKKIKINKNIEYPYFRYVVIRNINNFITIDLDD